MQEHMIEHLHVRCRFRSNNAQSCIALIGAEEIQAKMRKSIWRSVEQYGWIKQVHMLGMMML